MSNTGHMVMLVGFISTLAVSIQHIVIGNKFATLSVSM